MWWSPFGGPWLGVLDQSLGSQVRESFHMACACVYVRLPRLGQQVVVELFEAPLVRLAVIEWEQGLDVLAGGCLWTGFVTHRYVTTLQFSAGPPRPGLRSRRSRADVKAARNTQSGSRRTKC